MADYHYKVIRIAAQNIKRVEEVEISPAGDVITIGGANAAGKSSTLDALWYAFGGRRVIPDEVIRHGEVRAEVRVVLGGTATGGSGDRVYIIERTWHRDDEAEAIRSAIRVKVDIGDGNTAAVDSPQTWLDEIAGQLGIWDPHKFIRTLGPAQVAVLVSKFCDADTVAALDAELDQMQLDRRRLRQEIGGRRQTLADLETALGGEAAECPPDPLPELEAARAKRDEWDALQRRLEADARELITAENEITERAAALETATTRRDNIIRRIEDNRPAAEAEPPAVTADAYSAAVAASTARSAWQENAARRSSLADALAIDVDDFELLDADVARLRGERAECLHVISDLVPGLVVAGEGKETALRYNDTALADCSSAEQIRIGVALAMAADPALRVIRISDGSLMDPASLQTITELAAANDFQVWIEIVGADADIIIEDGRRV